MTIRAVSRPRGDLQIVNAWKCRRCGEALSNTRVHFADGAYRCNCGGACLPLNRTAWDQVNWAAEMAILRVAVEFELKRRMDGRRMTAAKAARAARRGLRDAQR